MASRRSDLERWFIRRGVPHFIEPYAAGPDVWSRAVPVLVIAYIAGGLNALDLRNWSWQENVAAGAFVVLVLFVTWALTNRLRGRPAFSRPHELGAPELAAFLIGPVIPSVVFGQWGDGLQALVVGAVVLLLIYLITSYGAVPLVSWAGSQTFAQLGVVGRMLTRALPLLLLFTTFLFINAEVWQVAGTLHGPVFVVVLGLFFLLGTAFVLSRVPTGMRSMAEFDDWAEVARLVQGTPADGIALPSSGDPAEIPLSVRQRVNVGLVSVFSQAILVTIVAVSLFVFFALLGFLAIPESTTAGWTGLDDVHVLVTWNVGGTTLVLSEPLLRVAGFLAMFSGMYFTVVLGTDATYRDEFLRDAGPEIRQALAVRLAYRHAAGSG